jgi:hypothetical protein
LQEITTQKLKDELYNNKGLIEKHHKLIKIWYKFETKSITPFYKKQDLITFIHNNYNIFKV